MAISEYQPLKPVMPCSWGVEAGMIHVWVAAFPLLLHIGHILNALEIEHCKVLYNKYAFFTFLYVTYLDYST